MTAAIIPLILAGLSFAASKLEKKPKAQQFPTLGPEQEGLQNKIIEMLGGNLGGGAFGQSNNFLQNLLSGDKSATEAFEKPYMREFQEQTVPQLAERFAGLGAGGTSSSYFQKALGSAGAGLQERLASLRSGLQLSAVPLAQNSLFGLLSAALQPRFNTGLSPGGPGALGNFLAPITAGYGQGIGKQLGGSKLPSWLGGS